MSNRESDEDNETLNTKYNDFKKIVTEFCNDLFTTFPEVKESVYNKYPNIYKNDTDDWSELYEHCKTVFPERFFDILYQNEEIFTTEETNTNFLPGIEFKTLWKAEGVTDNIRATIWKYLQLLLFTVISDVSDGKSFGDAAKLFEAINADEFKTKLEETFNNMKEFIDLSNVNVGGNEDGEASDKSASSGINMEGIPNPEQMHEHISGILGGKLGKLAHEIAEETASEINMEGVSSVGDVFTTLFKNPTKMMGLVKSVGEKLENKIKSGEIKESELLQEAGDIVKKMKNMPGMSNIQNMMKQMGLPADMMDLSNLGNLGNLGGKSKINLNAMQSQLERNMKLAQTKEKMRKKAMDRQQQTQQSASSASGNTLSEAELQKETEIMKLLNGGLNNSEIETLIFSTGEKVERSSKKDKSTIVNKEFQSQSQTKDDDKNKENNKNKDKKKKKNKNKD